MPATPGCTLSNQTHPILAQEAQAGAVIGLILASWARTISFSVLLPLALQATRLNWLSEVVEAL